MGMSETGGFSTVIGSLGVEKMFDLDSKASKRANFSSNWLFRGRIHKRDQAQLKLIFGSS